MRLPRPSASLVVSFLALFISLTGAGWAAIHLPARSVGNAQLQNFSVGNAKLRPNSVSAGKIIPGSVGAPQVNSSQVQVRVAGPCTAGAMQSISESGDVTCTPVLSNEYGAATQGAVSLSAGPATQILSKSLPARSSYLLLAYPHAVVSGTPTSTQEVEVDCTLAVPGANESINEDLAVDLGADSHTLAGSIPLALPVVSSPTGAQTATVTCTDSATPASPAPAVAVDATISAIQTASNS
ncbi:MAG TPA: hypothetical protein VMJ65_27755 [Solirubrobacteraceae bacterium]|nr:hypothetical protein [Solirubrobacteraceae bacterium]